MSYIAFDLDAFDAAESAARHAGASADAMMAGLLRLWRFCWRQRTDVVTPDQLRGVFGIDVGPALVAFGFVAQVGTSYRVKGADRYLRIQEGRSKGGKKAAGNLKRGKSPGKAPAAPRLVPGLVPAEAGEQPRLTPGLSANSEQRTASSELTAGARPHEWTAVVDVFAAAGLGKYNVERSTDPPAFKALLTQFGMPEILTRWRRGLENAKADRFPRVTSIAELRQHWNRLAVDSTKAAGPPSGAATAKATDWSDYKPGDTARELFGGKP